jgi:hypothetical protein
MIIIFNYALYFIPYIFTSNISLITSNKIKNNNKKLEDTTKNTHKYCFKTLL